jgi:hypothetical protein
MDDVEDVLRSLKCFLSTRLLARRACRAYVFHGQPPASRHVSRSGHPPPRDGRAVVSPEPRRPPSARVAAAPRSVEAFSFIFELDVSLAALLLDGAQPRRREERHARQQNARGLRVDPERHAVRRARVSPQRF